MDKKAIYQLILFLSITVISLTNIAHGIRDKENLLILAGAFSLALIFIATVIVVVRIKNKKSEQQ